MNNKIIDEIHKIRKDNYELTKEMTYEEKHNYIRKGCKEFLKLVDKYKRI